MNQLSCINSDVTNRSRRWIKACYWVLSVATVAVLSPEFALAGTLTTTRTSAFEYDSATGLITAEIVEPDSPQNCVRTTYAYTDATQTTNFGNKVSATTSNCSGASGRAVFASRTNATSFTGQTVSINGTAVAIPYGPYATTASNALSQSETHRFDPRFGSATQLTGPNALTTSWQLDDFGRKVRETRADGTGTQTDYCFVISQVSDASSNAYTCSVLPADSPAGAVMYVVSTPLDTAGNQNGPLVRIYYDRLNREIRRVTQSFDGDSQASRMIATDTLYNAQGAVVQVTEPYFLDMGSSLVSGTTAYGATMTRYDVLNRPVETLRADSLGSQPNVTFPDGRVSNAAHATMAYAGLSTTQANDKGQTQTAEKNALGRVVRTTDATGAQLASLYDPFDNLIRTLDPLGNVITISYDTRGRKTSMSDPDSGLLQYDYDALGQLVYQQNATQRTLGQSTSMSYDVLGRMTQRVEPEYTSAWTFDRYADGSACNKGIGRLCEVVTTNGTRRTSAFDSVGRPTTTQLILSGGPTFTSSVTYDAQNGRVASQTYPTGLTINYVYSALGYMQRLSGSNAIVTYWQGKRVNAWGKVESQAAGNGIETRQRFDALTGRVLEIDADPADNTNSVMRHRYGYDSIDNLTTRIDDRGPGNGQAVSETFSYDAINRLTQYQVGSSAIASAPRTVVMHYNALGAMLDKSDVGVYVYPSSGAGSVRPHAVSTVAGAAYTYDANGNLTGATSGKYRSIAYTSFNLPDSESGAVGPSNSPRYTWLYDADHQRVRETHVDGGGTRTTYEVHPDNAGGLSFEEEIAPNGSVTNRHYLTANGIPVGMLETSGALGSPSAGTLIQRYEYWHRDHLGSIAVTTDYGQNVTNRYAYDPFGKRRLTDGNYDGAGSIVADYPSATDRGFTGHEHLDDVGIVHMNGRLYDANTARFLQADAFVQQPTNLQSYQRYAYVFNNPLNATDPTGTFSLGRHALNLLTGNLNGLSADARTLSKNPYVRVAAAIAVAYFTGYANYGDYGYGIFGAEKATEISAFGFANAAAAGFAGGVVQSGTLKGGVNGLYSAALFYGAGSLGSSLGDGFAPGEVGAIGLHAAAGCVSSEINGGECGNGALSAAFSEAAVKMEVQDNRFVNVVIHSVVGGTASAIGGGKFTNGALTGAYGYLFNELLHQSDGTISGNRKAMLLAGYDDGFQNIFIPGNEAIQSICPECYVIGLGSSVRGFVGLVNYAASQVERLLITDMTSVLVNAEGRGGITAAQKFFDSLPKTGNVSAVDTKLGVVRTIELEGGGTASIRPFSQSNPGATTVQINIPGARTIKIRYD